MATYEIKLNTKANAKLIGLNTIFGAGEQLFEQQQVPQTLHKLDCNANKSFKTPTVVAEAVPKLPSVICTVVVCATPAAAAVPKAPAAKMGKQPLSPATNACVVVAAKPQLTPVKAVAAAENPFVTL